MGKQVHHVTDVSLRSSSPSKVQRTIPVYQIPELSILVKEGRQKYKLTQTELAQRTGLTIAEISRIESGNILKPSPKVLKALAPYTGVPYPDLLFYAGHSGDTDEAKYYDLSGTPIPCDTIMNDIYLADADLLSLLKDIHIYSSYEDRKLLKILLKLMKITHAQSGKNDSSTGTKKVFTATKSFLSIQLEELLNNLLYDNI